ncbi:hypothetical protein Esti_003296 [Eimeria stiedai]
MFECSVDGLTLKRIFEALKDTCAEVNFVCDADGCSMQAMDDSHVALVSTTWGVDMFHKYRCDSQMTLGLSVATILKATQPVKTNKHIVHLSTLKGTDEDEEVLHIAIEDPERTDTWHMEVALLTVVQERLRIPDEPYACVCTVDAKEFQELLRYIHSIAESVRIRGEKDSLVLSAKGENLSVTRVIHAPDMQCSEVFEQDFAVRYLSNFVKGASLCDRLEIAMTHGTPMRFTFPLPVPGQQSAGSMSVDAEEGSNLRFYVAPKIDED